MTRLLLMLAAFSLLADAGFCLEGGAPKPVAGRPSCRSVDGAGARRVSEACVAKRTRPKAEIEPADAIPGLVGTGYVAGGASLAQPGMLDGNFKLVSCPGGPCANQAYVTMAGDLFPGPWLANTISAQWIGPAIGGLETGIDPIGVYDYRETFDLTGYDLATVTVSGSFAADDVAGIALNGVAVGEESPGYTARTNFALTEGFQPGLNTIDFLVTNEMAGWFNPSGLIVELSGVSNPPATTTTLVAAPATLIVGQALTLTATVRGTSMIAPSGTVGFLNGSGVLATGSLDASGVAETTMYPAAGVYSVVAGYEGDRANGQSESAPVTVTVYAGPPTFAITTSGPLTLETQHHGSVTVTVTPQDGFAGEVTLGCGAVPQYVTCEWAHSQVQVSGGPATVQLEIDTSAVLDYESSNEGIGRRGAGIAVAGLCLMWVGRRRLRARVLMMLAMVCLAGSVVGCSTKYPPSTVPGTYAIPLWGVNGGVKSSGSLELVVTK